MASPTAWQQLLYLGGSKAPEEHLPWLRAQLASTTDVKSRVLLALPNALILAVFGVASLALFSDLTGLILLVGAVVALAAGAAVPALARRWAAWVARKNSISLSE